MPRSRSRARRPDPQPLAIGTSVLRLCQARAEKKGAVGVLIFADGEGFRATSQNGMDFKFQPPSYVPRIQRSQE